MPLSVVLGFTAVKKKVNVWTVNLHQCDQMARLFVQYLDINKNVKLPKSIDNFRSRLKFLHNSKYLLTNENRFTYSVVQLFFFGLIPVLSYKIEF